MKCPKCQTLIFHRSERCPRCGAVLIPAPPRRWPEPAPFSLTAEEKAVVTAGAAKDREDRGFMLDREIDELYRRDSEFRAAGDRWGGFFRRSLASFVDLGVVLALSAALFYTSYVGYSVGLAAHHRRLSAGDFGGLLSIAAWGSIGLAAGYFVLFHGMQGKTIGKWLFGLRVVGARRAPLTYGQALLRWLGTVSFLPLGSLWILCSGEKRAWHDHLAQTWVIRE